MGEESDAGEKKLLLVFNDLLRELDPDIIEGHNLFKFDLDYLRQRGKRHKVPCAWEAALVSQPNFAPASPEGGGALDRFSALRHSGSGR